RAFGPQARGDVGAAELDALGVRAEVHPHRGGDGREPLRVVEPHGLLSGRQAHEPIESPAVEQVPAELGGETAADRSLAGAARSGDRDHGDGWRHAFSPPPAPTSRPTAAAASRNDGNEVATSAVLRISIGAFASRLATENDIAMR